MARPMPQRTILGLLVGLALLTALALAALAPSTAEAHPQARRACTQHVTYHIGVGHVSCRFAIRAVRRMKWGGRKPGGWRCPGYRAGSYNGFGRCYSRGRAFVWVDGE